MTACIGYIAFSGSDRIDRPCPEPAAEIVTAGCVHEHVGERELCTMRAGEARSGDLLCGSCLDAKGAPHHCRLRVIAAVPAR